MKITLIHCLSICFFSLFLMSPSCEDEQIKEEKQQTSTTTENPSIQNDQEVKKEIKMISYRFDGDYAAMWQTVDSLEHLGLYESALKKVNEIFTHASAENNAPQVIRSVIYKMKYNTYLAEDDYVIAINELNEIADDSDFPLNQLIHSVTADVYWGYYQSNRWKFVNRTQTVNFKNEDIRTWDITKIIDHVNKHFLLSLSNADSLKRSKTMDFREILLVYNESEKLRPTLYDFLAFRALKYFENTESALNRPDERFVVSGQNYFGDAHAFLQVSTSSDDSLSNALHATRILKDLTAFHMNDPEPDAFIDLELFRLKFSRVHSKDENKEDWYIRGLERLADKFKNHPAYSEIKYYCALFNQGLGNSATTENTEHKWKLKNAVEICEEAIAKYPDSYGAKLCTNLVLSIKNKSLSFTSEDAYKPEHPGKMLMTYKNIDQIHYRLIEVKWDFFFNNNLYGEELIGEYLKYKPVESWSQNLTDPKDYQTHSIEVKIPAKPKGQYVLLASHSSDFRLEKNAIAYSAFWVSDLSYNYRKNEDESYDVYVTNRESGEPIKDVTATIYINKYNYLSRKYELDRQETYKSNENGFFTIRSKSDYRNIYIHLTKDDDHYNTLSQIYQYKPYKQNQSSTTTHFFTDRGIYRPGQTIYFKGIRIHHNSNEHSLEVAKQSTVKLIDPNYQLVSELKLTTNEYGTFSGSFVAPEGILNGQMHIEDGFGSKYFFVEEYKRPKFEVEFEPVSGVFKIGQKVKVSGKAKAFAGSSIDGATVKYRVVRSCHFPSWIWYRWGYYPPAGTIEVTNGTTTSDENGVFNIEFNAKEDAAIHKKYAPIYTYTVYADVTDINGETHSSQQWVRVGYNAMTLSVGVRLVMEQQEKNRFKIHTNNLNGEKVPARGTVKVTRLIENPGVYRTALWNRPDMPSFSEKEFRELFPNDLFSKENDVTKYEKGEVVFDEQFDTEKNDSIDFTNMKKWKPGRYVVEGTCIDEFGETVSDIQYIVILDKNDTKNPTNEIWSLTPIKMFCEPGENAEILISSAAKDLRVIYEIEHQGVIIKRELITLSQSQKRLLIPVEEKHRGNLSVHFTAVKFGRSYNFDQTIIVPYTNKTLDISFETFRDKLLPGQKEEWTLKIKGPKGEKVAAEMLAAMYDASLDEFASNSFYMQIFNSYYSYRYWYNNCFYSKHSQLYYKDWNEYAYNPVRRYDELNWWGYSISYYGYNRYYRGGADFSGDMDHGAVLYDAMEVDEEVAYAERSVSGEYESNAQITTEGKLSKNKDDKRNESFNGAVGGAFDTSISVTRSNNKRELGEVKARSNLNETAFFYPQLTTNSEGEILLKFTIPEALTKWSFIGMAHTKDLKTGFIQKDVVTQKELMVMPNAPRFFREGDKMTFTAKVSNVSEGDLEGSAQLMLFDALTMKPIDDLFKNEKAIIDFSAKKGQSSRLAWEIEVPFGIGAVTYRVVAKAKNHTDGEEMSIPVLSNRMLVTESLPLPSKGVGTKEFHFTKLINSGESETIKHHKLTLEYTSNPAWYAIQAMPYMMEYPYECSEQIFSRYYANALASHIVNSSPKIKEVFESWKESSPEAFLSNLEKNQELKSLILEETPWVLDAQNESERKKRVALLFDLHKMNRELDKTLSKLQKLQVSNGGWPWFPGMEESRYITQHIMTGMGHLDHLGVKDVRQNNKTWQMVVNGIRYLDDRIIEDYLWLKKHDPNYLTEQRINQIQVQYLYARSYFKDIPISNMLKEAFDYYQKQAAEYWKNFSLYNEGMIALQAKRYEIPTLPDQIMASLKERAIYHDELGMYWKDNVTGYFWYQAPIETQALLIEAFDEVSNDMSSVEEAKVWLLKQKQTTDWKTTKATAEACYALLLRGTELLANDEQVEVKVNGKVIDPKAIGAKVEAGTGYFKTSWEGDKIEPEMGNITVTRKTEGVSWGAMYWQYFEDLDKITPHETPLKLKKQLFLVQNTASGPVITPVEEGTKLQPGDKIRVRIELRSDRDMEYVHMKDMRASGFEPVNVFSRYKWQDGLGYYESTGDAATNFFMDYLRKGTYVFEYDLLVTHFGDFSNGITTIQCMYAPEFTSHSEGIRVKIEEKQ